MISCLYFSETLLSYFPFPYHVTNLDCASLLRENSTQLHVCVVLPFRLTMSQESSETRLAMGRLLKVGQLYDVRQDKELVSLLYKK